MMRRIKSKWFTILSVVLVLAGAVTVMASCDRNKNSNETEK